MKAQKRQTGRERKGQCSVSVDGYVKWKASVCLTWYLLKWKQRRGPVWPHQMLLAQLDIVFLCMCIWLGSVYEPVCMQTLKFLNITTLTRYPRCTKTNKTSGYRVQVVNAASLQKAQVLRWHCVQCLSMCVSQSVSAWVCCYRKRNLFTHVCEHKEVPFVFKQALQTLHHHREKHLSVGPAHMLCNTASLFKQDEAWWCLCVHM